MYAITVIALLLLVAVVVFIVQNTDKAEIQFFWWTGRVTIAGAIGVGALAGLLVGLIIGFMLQSPTAQEAQGGQQAGDPSRRAAGLTCRIKAADAVRPPHPQDVTRR